MLLWCMAVCRSSNVVQILNIRDRLNFLRVEGEIVALLHQNEALGHDMIVNLIAIRSMAMALPIGAGTALTDHGGRENGRPKKVLFILVAQYHMICQVDNKILFLRTRSG